MPTPSSDGAARFSLDAIEVVSGRWRDGPKGRVMFCVSTDLLDEGKGDLFVALGLARALHGLGWGVSLWPTKRYGEVAPDDVDVAVVMIESFVPGRLDSRTRAIAWVRNWAERWAELPYLDEFAAIWCSSDASAARMAEVYGGPTEVVPISVDTSLFSEAAAERRAGVVTTANFWGVERGITEALAAVSREVDVTWFGVNGRLLKGLGGVGHREAIPYMALPEVYSEWLVVVDDVIPAAAMYGNQNSRLFEALACGAMVVSNTANGLAELGLEAAPSYSGPDDLLEIVTGLVADPEGTARRARELQEIVIERHSTTARACGVDVLLSALGSNAPLRGGPRSPLIQWATRREAEHRAVREQFDGLQAAHHELSQVAALTKLHADQLEFRLAECEQQRDAPEVHSGRLDRLASAPQRAVRWMRRRADDRG